MEKFKIEKKIGKLENHKKIENQKPKKGEIENP